VEGLNADMDLRVILNVGKFLKSLTIGGLSNRIQLHEVSLFVRTYKRCYKHFTLPVKLKMQQSNNITAVSLDDDNVSRSI
jgi:hypothetical protein